jgi:hypothetical protein
MRIKKNTKCSKKTMFVEDWVGKDWNEKRVRLDMVGLGVTV